MSIRLLSRVTLGLLTGALVGTLLTVTANAQPGRQITVYKALRSPVLDGIVSPGEWNQTAVPQGEFTELRSAGGVTDGDLDQVGNRFTYTYDDDGLYFLGQDDWTPGLTPSADPGWGGFNGHSWFTFIDPNPDGEPPAAGENDSGSGYHMEIKVHQGLGGLIPDNGQAPEKVSQDVINAINALNGTKRTVNVYSEFKTNALFGNGAGYDSPTGQMINGHALNEGDPLKFIEVANNGFEGGSVQEVYIPWAVFRSTDPDSPNFPFPDDIYHPFAPSAGDVWRLSVARNSTNIGGGISFLPTWSAGLGANFFASKRAGDATFAGFKCDFDGSESCDNADIDALSADARGGGNAPAYDLNEDGVVDLAGDHPEWFSITDFNAADFDLNGSVTASGDGAVLLSGLSAVPQGELGHGAGDTNGDGNVNASTDGANLLSGLAGDHVEPGTAAAFYDPKTGMLAVHADGVARISIFSAGGNILSNAKENIGTFLVATVDNPNPGDLTWIALANSIGTVPGFEEVTGAVLTPRGPDFNGDPLTDLELRYQLVGGAPEGIEGLVTIVPEPGSLALLALAGLGLIAYRRRSA